MGNKTVVNKPKISAYASEMIEAIILAASEYYDISEDVLLSASSRDVTKIRHLCFWLIRVNTTLSSYIIGYRFNKTKNPVDHGITIIDSEKDVYGHILGDLRNIAAKANSFDKKYQWNVKVA